MTEVLVGVVGLGALILLFLTGIELGFAMALVGFVGFGTIVSFPAALNLLAPRTSTTCSPRTASR